MHKRPTTVEWTQYKLQCMREAGLKPSKQEMLNAITTETKLTKNYHAAELIFIDLVNLLELKFHDNQGRAVLDRQPHPKAAIGRIPPLQYDEANTLRRACHHMVRYAPSPQKAIDYSCFSFRLEDPIRSPDFETTIMINMIYVYNREGSSEGSAIWTERGLDLVKLGLQRGIMLEAPTSKYKNHPGEVFGAVSSPLLKRLGLQIADDMKSLVPLNSHPPP